MENTKPDEYLSGGTRYFYYEDLAVPLPHGATSVRATSSGATLQVTRTTLDASTDRARIIFGSPLRYRQARAIELSFAIPGAAPRSKDVTRVGNGYASFAVSSPGDAGSAKVTITAPEEMTFASSADGWEASKKAERQTVSLTSSAGDPSGLHAAVALRAPSASTRSIVLSGNTFRLAPWSDDAGWATFVEQQLRSGVPELERLTGKPWPAGLVDIREDASVNLYGYDGWFDSGSREVVVGEDLDPALIFHELSHAWSDGVSMESRWMYEGLAEVLAGRTAKAVGATGPALGPVRRTAKGALALSTWTTPEDGRATGADAYGYPASATVMGELLDGTGDSFTAVVGRAVDGLTVYDVGAERLLRGDPTDWRRLLDLVEVVGGNDDAAALMTRWVLTPTESAELAGRDTARTRYAALDEADGAWSPPGAVRRQMASWDFPTESGWTSAQATADQAARVQRLAADAVDVAALRAAYEGSRGPGQQQKAADLLTEAVPAVRALGAAHSAATDRNPLADLGARVLGTDGDTARAQVLLTDLDIARAQAVAEDAADRSRLATPVGLLVVVLTVLLVAGAALLLRRTRCRRFAPSAVAVKDASLALDA